MEQSIISEFKGVINDVEFWRQETFNSTSFLLEEIESKFKVSINDKEMVADVKDFIESAAGKVEGFSYEELEIATMNNIQAADKLEDVLFVSNELDDGAYPWNRHINAKISDPTKYTSIKRSIKENSKPTLSISNSKENSGLER